MSKKKKILLLCDDLRMHSGIATMAREFVIGTSHIFDWVQLGAAINHPDKGKIFDLSQEVNRIRNITDASVKVYPWNGYGDQDILRELLNVERPDAILHFTDPRFWDWLYKMEHEIRQIMPILYYNIWDDLPTPMYNQPYYESCDLLMCISKQTYGIVHEVLADKKYKDWQITYVPHGINHTMFFPINETHELYQEYLDFKKKELGGKEYDFIAFYNSRNIRRKHTSDLMIGFEEFVNTLTPEQRSKTLLLMHTDPVDSNGTDLPAVIEACCKNSNIDFTKTRPAEPKYMNFYYNMADVTVNIASNEGFGLGTAESIMAGTPIIVNVTGGLQDQCGFVDEHNQFLTERHYKGSWKSNHTGKYLVHGKWCTPVWPKALTLQGSIPTPYIFDDIVDYRDLVEPLKFWYSMSRENRKAFGLSGREHFMKPETGLSAENMCNRFINDMNTAFKYWEPRKRFELILA